MNRKFPVSVIFLIIALFLNFAEKLTLYLFAPEFIARFDGHAFYLGLFGTAVEIIALAGVISGVFYKGDLKQYRQANKVGLWGNVIFVIYHILLFVLFTQGIVIPFSPL